MPSIWMRCAPEAAGAVCAAGYLARSAHRRGRTPVTSSPRDVFGQRRTTGGTLRSGPRAGRGRPWRVLGACSSRCSPWTTRRPSSTSTLTSRLTSMPGSSSRTTASSPSLTISAAGSEGRGAAAWTSRGRGRTEEIADQPVSAPRRSRPRCEFGRLLMFTPWLRCPTGDLDRPVRRLERERRVRFKFHLGVHLSDGLTAAPMPAVRTP